MRINDVHIKEVVKLKLEEAKKLYEVERALDRQYQDVTWTSNVTWRSGYPYSFQPPVVAMAFRYYRQTGRKIVAMSDGSFILTGILFRDYEQREDKLINKKGTIYFTEVLGRTDWVPYK